MTTQPPQSFKGRLHPIRCKTTAIPITGDGMRKFWTPDTKPTEAPIQITGWLTDRTGQRINFTGRQEPDGSFELLGELIPAPAKPRRKIEV